MQTLNHAEFNCEQVARAGLGGPVKHESGELLYRCLHPEKHKNGDSHPSLKINSKKNVWACFPCGAGGTPWQLAAFLAGCEPGDKERVKTWLKEKGLSNGAKRKAKAGGRIVATYDYVDESGKLLFQVVRFDPKDFRQRRPDSKGGWVWHLDCYAKCECNPKLPPTRRVLYNLPAILKSDITERVYILEGEKDVEEARKLGFTATCNPGGAGKWRPGYSEFLRGRRVVIIPDADERGRAHAQQVAASVHDKAASVKVAEIPGHKDLAEAIEAAMTREGLLSLFEQTPEWQPASGAEILESVVGFVRRFVSLTEAQARAVALWVAHTHAFDAADCTPYLAINSAEKQSGKTRLLEVLRLLVFCPWFTGRVSAAVLYRKIDKGHLTLLLDESDAAFHGEKEYGEALRGILNTGYRRGGAASCCVGQGANITDKDFSTFCPKAIAGIGRLPDTVQDRSLPIKLKRARRGAVARFREREAQGEASELAARLGAWCTANLEALRKARPDIPAQLSDRQADCAEPLLCVADLAGGDWPKAARTALVELCGVAQLDDDSTGANLLRDIRAVFKEKEAGELSSGELCESLAKVETSPWGEWRGKPITPAGLARLLKPFEIIPDRIGGKASQSRGYTLGQFDDSFRLYLPSETVNPSTDRVNTGENEDLKPSTESPVDTPKNTVSPNKNAGGGRVDTLKAGVGGQEESKKATLPLRFQEDKEVLEV